MTATNPPAVTFSFPWKSRIQGLPELITLLNYLPQPALIIDRVRGQVWAANTAFLQLTAFAMGEIYGQPVTNLLPGLAQNLNAVEDRIYGTLRRRMRDSIPVTAQLRLMEANSPLMVVQIGLEDAAVTRHVLQQQLLQVVESFSYIPNEEAYQPHLIKAVQMAKEMMDVSVAAIYQANPEAPRLDRMACAGNADLLPESLPSMDLIRLSKLSIWRPGKRVQVELHRVGRVNNLEFVATTPLGPGSGLFGLLVTADIRQPMEHWDLVLEMFGLQIGRLIHTQVLVSTLKKQVDDQQKFMNVVRTAMDNAQEGIILVNPQMEVETMNPAAEWMLGYADWEVKSQLLLNVLIGPESLMPALTAALEGIPTHNIGNVSLHRRNGQLFPAHIQTIPVSNQEHEVTSLLVFISDVSEHEEIRNRTQQLEQRAVLGEVTAVFAHEVRNPINNIYSGLQLLSATLPENDPNQDNLTRLQHDCMRLNHLMESVLNFSKNTQTQFEPVDIKQLIQRILDRWKPRFNKVNVEALFQSEGDIPKVSGDPRSLEQVFTNLVSNAVEAMKTGGMLAVRVSPVHNMPNMPQVLVTVSDNGPGIPDEVRDRIFEPFVTTKSVGTGLGLAITKRIVTAHHGSIQVNTFPGGTVFEVTLLAYTGESA